MRFAGVVRKNFLSRGHRSTAFQSRLCRPQMTVHLRNRTRGAKRGIRRVLGNQSRRVQLLTYVLSSACEKSDAVPIRRRAISCAFVPSQYHLYLFGDSPTELYNYKCSYNDSSVRASYGVADGISAGIPTSTCTGIGLLSRKAGLNFHWLNASRALSSISVNTL